MTRVAYFPPVDEPSALIDIISRAAWFLAVPTTERIFVPISDSDLSRVPWDVAPGMDPAIGERFPELRELVEFVPVTTGQDIARMMEQVDTVLRWREASSTSLVGATQLEEWLEEKQTESVDPRTDRQEGGNYINVSFAAVRRQTAAVRENEAKFARFAERIGKRDRANILATGPSVKEFANFDYKDSLNIACNSVILDDKLMETVQPEILVFADPIFHFGPSQYAGTFRESVRRAAQVHDFTIFMPRKYESVFLAALPELADRTIALPFQKDRHFNFDLRDKFELKTTANVLTFVMVPLATTFARRVGFLGCDGRPLDQNNYFWSHNRSTQINDKMANIREVHPAFFAIDYDDYYAEHCVTLADQLSAAEASGLRFESMGFSHIPALAARARGAATNGGGQIAGPDIPEGKGPRVASAPPSRRTDGATPTPRLLVIDPTATGERNATGQIKKNLLRNWPSDRFLQVCATPGTSENSYALLRSPDALADTAKGRADLERVPLEEALREVERFAPDVLYYRPVIDQHPRLQELAEAILGASSVPLVTHLMDDWPGRLAATEPNRAGPADAALRSVLARSQRVLSISEKMSEEFGERYGMPLEPIANGIDVDLYKRTGAAATETKAGRSEVIVRYCGALAKDMTFDTVVDVARAVDALQGKVSVRLEIYTMPAWRAEIEAATQSLSGVDVLDTVPDDEYPALLAEADILLVGYNFDRDSLQYVRLSMPNKLPECLGSGAAVLAVGPHEAAGIDYVASRKLARCVTKRDEKRLKAALRQLVEDSDQRDRIAARAQRWAFKELNVADIADRFQDILKAAASQRRKQALLSEPLSRAAEARVDETHAVARLLNVTGRDRVLVDVGAHFGSSLAPFARADWTVVACEPDPANRQRLEKRFGDRQNVTIDPRAVSDTPAPAASFFSSDESSGISALHAFRSTHQESATVEVTTVAEIVEAHGLDRVDFLKIDVEGFDWNVLKGVPWDRVRPRVIETEFEDAKTVPLGHTYQDVADYLVARGYTVFLSEWHPIVRYGIPHQWRQLVRYPSPLGSDQAWGNILAFEEDPGDDSLTAAFADCLEVEDPDAVERAAHGGGRRDDGLMQGPPGAGVPAPAATRSPKRVFRRQPSRRVGDASQRRGRERLPVQVVAGVLGISVLGALIAAGALTSGAVSLVLLVTAALALCLCTAMVVVAARRSAHVGAAYERVYVKAAGNPPVLFVGRAAMWIARKVRTYWAWSLGYLALAGALVAAAATDLGGYELVAWSLVGLLLAGSVALAVAGFMRFLVKEAGHEAQLQLDSLRTRQQRTEFRQDRIRERLAQSDVRQDHARTRLTRAEVRHARVARELSEVRASQATSTSSLRDVQAAVERLRAAQRTTKGALIKRISELDAAQDSAGARLESRIAELKAVQAAAQAQLEQVEAHIAETNADRAAARADNTELERLGRRISELEAAQDAHRSTWKAELASLAEQESARREGVQSKLEVEQTRTLAILEARLAELDTQQRLASEAFAEQIAGVKKDLEPLGALGGLRESLSKELSRAVDALEPRVRDLEEAADPASEVLERLRDVDKRHGTVVAKLEARIAELEQVDHGATLEEKLRTVTDRQTDSLMEYEQRLAERSKAIDELRSQLSRLEDLPEAIKVMRRELKRRQSASEGTEKEWRRTSEERLTEIEAEARANGGRLREQLSRLEDSHHTAEATLKLRIANLEAKLAESLDELRQNVRRPDLQLPTPGAIAWKPLKAAAGKERARPEGRLHVVFSGSEGLQPLTRPTLLSVEAPSGVGTVGVNRFSELDSEGRHETRWTIDSTGDSGSISLLMAFKPEGRRFIEVGLHGTKPIVSGRFDIEDATFLGGSGPAAAVAAIQIVADDWRTCSIRCPLPSRRPAAMEVVVALAASSDFDFVYDGRLSRGITAADPVVIGG